MTQQKHKVVVEGTKFTKTLWMDIVSKIVEMNNFDQDTRSKIEKHQVIKLIAGIPFIAGCNNPLRTALSHVSIYFLAASKAGKNTFVHTEDDDQDYLLRLERISHFDGGDKTIINKGMDLLALTMIEDYFRDMKEDRTKGKYNPFISGTWNYFQMKNMLSAKILKYHLQNLMIY